jgi:hypothetical protein
MQLTDRKGTPLNEGDIVAVSDGYRFNFYAEVKYLEKEKALAPFHTFSFHSFEKVDKVPDNAIQSNEERYKIWYVQRELALEDVEKDHFSKYLMDWRQCEHLLGNGRSHEIYRIEKLES